MHAAGVVAPTRARAAVVAAVLAVAVGCGEADRGPRFRPAGNPAPRPGGTLTFSTYGNLRTLDPAVAYDEVSIYALHHVYDTLVGYEPARPGDPSSGLTLVPQLATAWTLSPDGRTYAFALRRDATFSDGKPVVAGDFVTAFERVLRTPASPFHAFLAPIVGAEAFAAGDADEIAGLRVVDDLHLEVTLTAPDAAFLYVLAMPFTTPLDRAFVDAHGGELRAAARGTGPFEVASWAEGERLVLVRNPRYWDAPRPWLDQLVMLENVPRDVAFLQFEQGALDALDRMSTADWLWLATRADWSPHVHTRPQMAVYGVRMNVTVPPFDDVRVRRALNLARNKDHVMKLHAGLAVPSHGMLPPGLLGRDDALAPYPYDPDRARALLAEAGYPDGFDVEFVTIKDDTVEKLAQSLQADLAAIGVRVTITVMSFATYLSAVTRRDGPPLSLSTWLMDYPDPSSFLDVRFHSRTIADLNSSNDSFYANPEVDRLLDEARRTTAPDRRAALYRRVERILYDDAPWIWESHPVAVEVVQPYVRDYAIHPVWVRDFRSVWLDLDADGRRLPR